MGRGSTPQTEAPRPTRVVALTRHASLEVTLAYIARTGQWDVQTVPGAEEALTAGAEVAVVALETVEASRQAVARLREATGSPACLVIADGDLPEDDTAKPDAVLLRPFTLDELVASVEGLVSVRPAARATPAAAPRPVRERAVAQPVEAPAPARAGGDGPRQPRPVRPARVPAPPKQVPPVPKVKVAVAPRPLPAAPSGAWAWSFEPGAAAPVARSTRAVAPTPRRAAAPGRPAVRKTGRGTPPPIDRSWPTEGPLARRARPLGN
jgi:hypothetical protein